MRTFLGRVKRAVVGAPIATDSARPMILRSRVALAVFGTGLLSTVAYAPDAVLDALRRGGLGSALPWMAGGVVLLMLLLGFAYRSNVHYRPDERADYGLVREKLGARAGLVTGAALLVDYLFTVAVSIAAAAQFLVYLFPRIDGWEPLLAIGVMLLMTLVTLRGIRDRARVLGTVWFGFLVIVGVLFVVGVPRAGGLPPSAAVDNPSTWGVVAAFAGAIASGGVMLTGVEHLAAAAPFHAEPKGRRAGRTLIVATAASAVAFFTMSWLTWQFRVTGWRDGPLMMQVTDAVFGSVAARVLVALFAVAILYAAASSVFRRFAGLSSVLAADSYLPRQLAMRNDRLVYRGGVLTIAIASALVVLATQASLPQLIHMYVVGVFTSIVLSQVAMVRLIGAKIALETEPRALLRLRGTRVLHVAAALAATAVWAVVAVFNFVNGAWIAIALIVALVLLMRAILKHYESVREELQIQPRDSAAALPSATHGIVLVAQLHRPALRALSYAKVARHSSLEAVGVRVDAEAARQLQQQWTRMDLGIPLVILDSPYRDIVGPVMDYVKRIHRDSPRDVVVFYVPEYIVGRWWERFLHNRATARLRSLLLRTPGVVVSAVPWHLSSVRDHVATLEGPGDEHH